MVCARFILLLLCLPECFSRIGLCWCLLLCTGCSFPCFLLSTCCACFMQHTATCKRAALLEFGSIEWFLFKAVDVLLFVFYKAYWKIICSFVSMKALSRVAFGKILLSSLRFSWTNAKLIHKFTSLVFTNTEACSGCNFLSRCGNSERKISACKRTSHSSNLKTLK